MRLLILGFLIAFAAPVDAMAAPMRLKVFGMDLELKEVGGQEQQLVVDGRVLHTAPLLSIAEVASVAGVGVVVGTSGMGGNMCDSTHFVLSKSPGSPARLDGPIDACGSVLATVGSEAIRFEQPARPGRLGQRWQWTYATGMRSLGSVAFQPSERGWPELRERTVNHPGQLLEFRSIADQARSALGGNFAAFARIIDGPGSADFQGDLLIGKACAPHRCGDEEAIIAADLRSQRLFIALKLESSPIAVFPPVADWPSAARAALREWARKWR